MSSLSEGDSQALNAGQIAYPLRMMLARYRNVTVYKGVVERIDPAEKKVFTDFGELDYDYLVLACGAKHHYFGHNGWEEHAPGLKTISQASEIRRRVMDAYEKAERTRDPSEKRRMLTFVVVGGGPTGVEPAGSIGEMSRYYLSKYYRNIDPKLARIFIVHSAPRILQTFSPELSGRATRALEKLGVQVWTCSLVSGGIDANGVQVGNERGSKPGQCSGRPGSRLPGSSGVRGFETDNSGRIHVTDELSVPGYPDVFAGGDQACFTLADGDALPGMASVSLQQGRAIGRNILLSARGEARKAFRYKDKGQMATIGKNMAIAEKGNVKLHGLFAWIIWIGVHIYYLSSVRHRFFVLMQWAWSYFTFGHEARIVHGSSARSGAFTPIFRNGPNRRSRLSWLCIRDVAMFPACRCRRNRTKRSCLPCTGGSSCCRRARGGSLR